MVFILSLVSHKDPYLDPYYLLFILHLFRMSYKPTISTACSMLMTFKYILLLTLTIRATPSLPCGNVLSIFSHGTPETSFGDSIIFAGTEINITKKARNLGVIMDNNLSFSSQINEICKKSTLAIKSIDVRLARRT